MKDKKGFTLVELLAVIAILAILVIIALPNVLSMFRNAKQNTFTNEVQNLVKSAENKYLTNSMNNVSGEMCFDSKSNKLDMTGRDNIIYKIKLSDTGKLIEVSVADDNYELIVKEEAGINKADIGNKYKVNVTSEETTIVSCDNIALKGEYVDKKLIIKKDNEEIKTIQMEKNTTTTIDKESGLSLITCNNGIEVSEENDKIKLNNVLVNNSVCNFSNDLSNVVDNIDDTQNSLLLLNDLNLDKQVTINKPLTIDMNGKSINSTLTASVSTSFIINNSNLTIKNNSKNESSIISNTSIILNNKNALLNLNNVKLICNETENAYSTIYNSGKLIVKNSYIKGYYGIGRNAENATFDIYDSEIIGTITNGINLNENSASNGNIYNSTITGKSNAIFSGSSGIVNIYSGTFTGQTGNGILNQSSGTINICSGEISGAAYDLNNASTGTINYTSKVTLKNGTTNGTNINLTDDITCE